MIRSVLSPPPADSGVYGQAIEEAALRIDWLRSASYMVHGTRAVAIGRLARAFKKLAHDCKVEVCAEHPVADPSRPYRPTGCDLVLVFDLERIAHPVIFLNNAVESAHVVYVEAAILETNPAKIEPASQAILYTPYALERLARRLDRRAIDIRNPTPNRVSAIFLK